MLVSRLLLAVACCTAITAESRDVYYQGALAPRNIGPTFDKGYLVVYDRDHKIDVYAPDGSPLYSVSAHVPKADWVNFENAAVDTDGTLAGAVACGRGNSITGAGIVLFDRTGHQTAFFDTGEYRPTQTSFAPDHSIWVLGWKPPRKDRENRDYFILRNFSQEGKELGAYLPRSSFAPEPEPVISSIGSWKIRTTKERVGAFLYYANPLVKPGEGEVTQWIETDLNGKETGRWDFRGDYYPLALTQSGALYGQGDGLAVFDRATNTWRPVPGMPDGHLLGADGENLVFWLRGASTLRWVPAK